jgi:hypothetical protein
VSWAAHQFEGYVLQRHIGEACTVSYLAIVAGDAAPDFFSKAWVYGVTFHGHHYGAKDPATFHRGWPGAGFTHSLAFGVFLAAIVWFAGRGRPWATSWALGIIVGQWAHAITDINDSKGTMLLFPFTTHGFSTGAWAYAAQVGKYQDAASYYSSLGFAMDALWLVIVVVSWRVLTRDYFERVVRPADPGAWNWINRRVPDAALVAVYRAMFLYGVARMISWTFWTHVVAHYAWDLGWTGPSWLHKVPPSTQTWAWAIRGVIGVAIAMGVLWLVALRHRPRVVPLPPEVVPPRRDWWGRNQGYFVYPFAVISYAAIGVWFHPILNWIVGPCWMVAVVWLASAADDRLQLANR